MLGCPLEALHFFRHHQLQSSMIPSSRMISLTGAQRLLIQRGGILARRLNCSIGRSFVTKSSPLPRASLRFNSTSSAPKVASKKPVRYPERLLIYNAGTGRTVFIGCLKVTTIFVFGFFCTVVAPAYYYAPDQPAWIAGVVILAGLIPMIIVTYTTAPFVTYIHLRLPEFARQSREQLMRYSTYLPRNAKIDLTTLNIIGRPRVSRVGVGELYPARSLFSVMNYAREIKLEDAKRPWWSGRPVTQFAILEGLGKSREDGVWKNVARSINMYHNTRDDARIRK